MSTEYGVFSDEGCIESGLWNRESAASSLSWYRADYEACGYDPDVLSVSEMCPDHEEEARDSCEECSADEDEDSDELDDEDELAEVA